MNRNDSPRVHEVDFTSQSYDHSQSVRNRFDHSRDHSTGSSHSSVTQRRSFCSNNKEPDLHFHPHVTNISSHYTTQNRHFSGLINFICVLI